MNKCIKQIRAALSDNADNPLYLETIPRHGYRFLVPVRTKIVPAPLPQVKEASSGLIANLAGQVRARVEAASQSGASAQQQAADAIAETPTQETSSVPQASARTMGSRILWWVVPLALLLAAALYWFLSRAMR